jgi:hypothetical protein
VPAAFVYMPIRSGSGTVMPLRVKLLLRGPLVKDTERGQPEVMTSKSSDGMHWSSPIAAIMIGPVTNYHVESIGISSDELGRLAPRESVLIAFGAPYSLGTILPDTSPGMWSLYGSYSAKSRPR